MPTWEILEVCRDTTITEPPPQFRVTLRDEDNHGEGVLPTRVFASEDELRQDILIKLGISEDEINAAFTNPPNCL